MNFNPNLEILQAGKEDALYFRCREHGYWGSSKAPLAIGCAACWGAHYLIVYGKYHTKPGEDEAFEAVLTHAAEELERTGNFDFEAFKRPKFKKEEESESSISLVR